MGGDKQDGWCGYHGCTGWYTTRVGDVAGFCNIPSCNRSWWSKAGGFAKVYTTPLGPAPRGPPPLHPPGHPQDLPPPKQNKCGVYFCEPHHQGGEIWRGGPIRFAAEAPRPSRQQLRCHRCRPILDAQEKSDIGTTRCAQPRPAADTTRCAQPVDAIGAVPRSTSSG